MKKILIAEDSATMNASANAYPAQSFAPDRGRAALEVYLG